MTFHGELIWIIGASSGIGAAVAKALSDAGAQLVLSARTETALYDLNESLGGQHLVYPLDVSDGDQVQQAADKLAQILQNNQKDARHQPTTSNLINDNEAEISQDTNLMSNSLNKTRRLDRILFMAATYRPAKVNNLDRAFADKLVRINLLGAIYVTYAALPLFRGQNCGQLVLCASVAGFTGLPGGQPYSATKAALINFAESLYAEVEDSIDIKVINPGFVRTRITDKNNFPMPLRIQPEQAAEAIIKGLKQKAFEIHFPKAFTRTAKLLRLMPYWLALPITRRMNQKS